MIIKIIIIILITACLFKCVECKNESNICTICKGNRLNPPTCNCPENRYEDNISETCPCIINNKWY